MNETRIEGLERQVRLLRTYGLVLTLGILAAAVTGLRPAVPEDGVIRVRGIVVEDSLGRERILIGAPVPSAANRVRTDTTRAFGTWGGRFPPAYRDWYAGYLHAVNGILVLDTAGFDRLAVGHDLPDPNIGPRIGRSTGLIINDSSGFERSGYSLLTVDGADRMVLGLDRGASEAVTLGVYEDGTSGLTIGGGDEQLMLGQFPAEDVGVSGPEPFFGLVVREDERASTVTAGSRGAQASSP